MLGVRRRPSPLYIVAALFYCIPEVVMSPSCLPFLAGAHGLKGDGKLSCRDELAAGAMSTVVYICFSSSDKSCLLLMRSALHVTAYEQTRASEVLAWKLERMSCIKERATMRSVVGGE